MRTTAFLLLMLSAATAAQARSAYHQERYGRPPVEDHLGLRGSPSVIGAPIQDRHGCNGGPCTLTGGPSGGPNQT